MDVICNNCKQVNTISTLHCRNCGAKITDEARKKALAKKERPSLGKLIKFIISRIIFYGVLLCIPIAAFIPFGLPQIELVAEDAQAKVMFNYKLLKKNLEAGAVKKIGVTPEKINTIIAKLIEDENKGRDELLNLTQLGVRISGENHIVIQAKMKLFDEIPAYVEIEGQPVMTNGKIDMEVDNVTIGHLPLPTMFFSYFVDKLKTEVQSYPKIVKVLSEVKKIDVTPEKIKVALQRNLEHNPKIGKTKLKLRYEKNKLTN